MNDNQPLLNTINNQKLTKKIETKFTTFDSLINNLRYIITTDGKKAKARENKTNKTHVEFSTD